MSLNEKCNTGKWYFLPNWLTIPTRIQWDWFLFGESGEENLQNQNKHTPNVIWKNVSNIFNWVEILSMHNEATVHKITWFYHKQHADKGGKVASNRSHHIKCIT